MSEVSNDPFSPSKNKTSTPPPCLELGGVQSGSPTPSLMGDSETTEVDEPLPTYSTDIERLAVYTARMELYAKLLQFELSRAKAMKHLRAQAVVHEAPSSDTQQDEANTMDEYSASPVHRINYKVAAENDYSGVGLALDDHQKSQNLTQTPEMKVDIDNEKVKYEEHNAEDQDHGLSHPKTQVSEELEAEIAELMLDPTESMIDEFYEIFWEINSDEEWDFI